MARRGTWSGLLVGLLLALMMVSSVSAATTYTDLQGRFSVTVPDNFRATAERSTSIAVSYESQTYRGASFNVVIASGSPAGTTLVNGVTMALSAFPKTFKGYQPGPNNYAAATLGGQPAVVLDSFFMGDTGRIHLLQYTVLYGSTAYVLTIGALESDFDTVLRDTRVVRDSFTFLVAPDGDIALRLGNG